MRGRVINSEYFYEGQRIELEPNSVKWFGYEYQYGTIVGFHGGLFFVELDVELNKKPKKVSLGRRSFY